MHAGFSRRAPTFLAVARDAAADDVFPILVAALGDRHDMVEGQLARGEPISAVLAAMIVPRVDIRAREGHIIERRLILM